VRRQLADPDLRCVLTTSCHTARSVNASLPTRPFASTRRKIGPFSIPATSSHPSISCFTHSGTATDRVLFPFPLKSRNTQQPSRITRCSQFMRDNSPRRQAHVTSTPSSARSRIPRMLCGFGACNKVQLDSSLSAARKVAKIPNNDETFPVSMSL
jgi:hypothetical protein